METCVSLDAFCHGNSLHVKLLAISISGKSTKITLGMYNVTTNEWIKTIKRKQRINQQQYKQNPKIH